MSAPPRGTAVAPELGFYALAGHVESPRDMLAELRLAEDLGLGAAFLSERLNVKEAASLSGAAVAVTEHLRVVTAATNQSWRHPAVTAAWATTVHRLSGGRFVLGLGRGLAAQFAAFGLPPVTTAGMEDFIGVMRRLWRGETVADHDGPAGRYPMLRLDPTFDEAIPIGLVGLGPATLDLAGRAADLLVLHPFLSDDAVRRCVARVRGAAERAGRDPRSVQVWACLPIVPDPVGDEATLRRVVARLATYMQMYGDLMVRVNEWDPAVLKRFREDPVVSQLAGWADAVATPPQVEHLAALLPDEWTELAAVGDGVRCAEAVRRQLGLGVDGVLMHGSTPTQLAPVVAAYCAKGESQRPNR
jgi:probable F420-dependent oxidoreductase